MGCIIGGEEQHRLCNVIGFTDASQRRGGADPLLECLFGFRGGMGSIFLFNRPYTRFQSGKGLDSSG